MKLFLFFKTSTVPVNYVFLKIFSNVRTYVTVRIDEDKITSERILFEKNMVQLGLG